MSLVTFECKQCRFKTTKYNSHWKKHLTSESHQLKSRERIKNFKQKDKEKSVVVFGLHAVKMQDALKYFSNLSIVTDFIFWKDRPDFCIIEFLLRYARSSIADSKHTINGNEVLLRPRDDIPEIEWLSICPFVSPHVKIEIDLRSSPSPENLYNNEMDIEEVNMNENNANLNQVSINMSVPSNAAESNDQSSDDENVVSETLSSSLDNHTINEQQFPNNIEETWDEGESYQKYSESNAESPSSGHIPGFEISLEKDLDTQMEEFYNANLMPLAEWTYRAYVKERLELILRKCFTKCNLIPFGAGSTAISSGRDPFNMFIDYRGITTRNPTKNNSNIPISYVMDLTPNVCQELKNNLHKVLSDSSSIKKLKVASEGDPKPDQISFRFCEKSRQMLCTIQTSNFLAVQSCRLVNFFCSLDHRVRALLIVARHWAFHNRLLQSIPNASRKIPDSLHPAIIQWLVLFFLIKKKIIPPISTLQNHSEVELIHKGKNIAFSSKSEHIKEIMKKCESSYEKNPLTGNPSANAILCLACDMFEFYSKLDFKLYFVCLNIGKVLPKQNSNLTEIDIQSAMCVLHPFKLNINMTFNVSSGLKDSFIFECQKAHFLLNKFLKRGQGNVGSILDLLSGRLDLNENSLKEIEDYFENETNPTQGDINLQMETNQTRENMYLQYQDSSPKSIHKIKRFGQNFQMSSEFVNAAQLVKNPKIRAEIDKSLPELWLKFLKDFNSIVWPVCFGVTLFEMTTTETNKPQQKAIGFKVKGIMENPGKLNLNWINQKPNTNKKVYNNAKSDYFTQIRGTIPMKLKQYDAGILQIEKNCALLFQYQLYSLTRKNSDGTKASCLLQFSDIRGRLTNLRIKTKNLFRMHAELWKMYSLSRLCSAR